jgi:signal transduction histidine kinase
VTALNKLRALLLAFFAALAVPTVVLIAQALDRLQWEAFHQHQQLAEEFATRIDGRLAELIGHEDARAFTEYAFFNVLNSSTNLLQRSPLASYPPVAAMPGLIGYFQIDTAGTFSAPFLPPAGTDADAAGIPLAELTERQALATRIQIILRDNRLLSRVRRAEAPPLAMRAEIAEADRPLNESAVSSLRDERKDEPAPTQSIAPSAQAAFDRLNETQGEAATSSAQKTLNSLGRVADLKLEQRYAAASPASEGKVKQALEKEGGKKRAVRKEQSVLPEPATSLAHQSSRADDDAFRVRTFESEVDAFQMSLLGSGQLVFFRRVWRGGEHYVQGLLLERDPFLADLLATPFAETALSRMSNMLVAYRGEILSAFNGERPRSYPDDQKLRGTLLYQTRLSAPLSDLDLIFSINRLPAGPGVRVIGWLGAVLALVLCGGSLLMYRLGARQIALARQQQDFVSAVSHELRTPLTSIRMYGEMLREGWAPEEKRQEYYAFIHDESERLSRLINNVLNLARMTRHELDINPQVVTVDQLNDLIRSKAGSVIEHAGRSYGLVCTSEIAKLTVEVDLDCFTQVVLNLVDNALKFSVRAANQRIEIEVRALPRKRIEFAVRDFGPGIPSHQLERIFGLFYRGENALTRETVGTGIGLALVSRLAQGMRGTVDAVNREPGAEFRLRLPRAIRSTSGRNCRASLRS